MEAYQAAKIHLKYKKILLDNYKLWGSHETSENSEELSAFSDLDGDYMSMEMPKDILVCPKTSAKPEGLTIEGIPHSLEHKLW